jgi:hypothetical protein|tara:strand:+ start:748 stop:960 length:213 start_codon:yes stop_codon:yes gene_type:complete
MKEEETVKMTLRVPKTLWQRFHDHCEERLMTKNKLMIRIMDSYLKAVGMQKNDTDYLMKSVIKKGDDDND